MKVLELDDIKKILDRNEAIIVTEKAFISQSSGNAITPKPFVFDVKDNDGEICIKTAFVPSLKTYTIKQVSYFGNLEKNKLKGTINVYNSKTGGLQLLINENGRLTSVRTACGVAVADKYFSQKNRTILGLIGLGNQANFIIQALLISYPKYEKIYLWNRNKQKIDFFINKWGKKYPNIKFIICDNTEIVIENAETVVTSTSAKNPIIYNKNINNNGLTIIAIGSDTVEKSELEPIIYNKNKVFVDSIESNLLLGDIYNGLQKKIIKKADINGEIGEILLGKKKGRINNNECVIVKMVGLGIQDSFIGNYIYEKSLIQCS